MRSAAGNSVRANIQAWHSDLRADIGEGFAIYPSHNLHIAPVCGVDDGQGGIAIQAGKDYAKLTATTYTTSLTLVRFGRFDEIPAITERPEDTIAAGMWGLWPGLRKTPGR